jgi:hypothetical protein
MQARVEYYNAIDAEEVLTQHLASFLTGDPLQRLKVLLLLTHTHVLRQLIMHLCLVVGAVVVPVVVVVVVSMVEGNDGGGSTPDVVGCGGWTTDGLVPLPVVLVVMAALAGLAGGKCGGNW